MLQQVVYTVTTELYTVKGKNSVHAVRARAVNGRRNGEAMRQNFSEGFCCPLSIRIPPTPQIYSCLRLGMGNRPATGAVPRDSPQQYWSNGQSARYRSSSQRKSTAVLTQWVIGPLQEQFPETVHSSTDPVLAVTPSISPHLLFSCLISTLRGRDSSVGIATRLRTGRSGGWIPLKARDFCLLHNVHTGSEAHPVTCSLGTKVLCRGVQRPGVRLTTRLHLAPGLRMNGAIPLHTLRIRGVDRNNCTFFMALFDRKCLIRWGDNNCE
jgi:hypothetical protein